MQKQKVYTTLIRRNLYSFIPVRTIRRKNIFEAAMISLLSGEGSNLVQTLPGISDQEIKYSNLISEYYRRGYIRGLWGTGVKGSAAESDLKTVIAMSDCIISSSVMEGFGYIFTDTVSWGKPILSRYLDTSQDFIPLFRDYSSYFYENFRIPLTGDMRLSLTKEIKAYFSSLDREFKDIVKEEEYINYIVSGNTADFSYLPYEMQGKYLAETSKSTLLKSEIREINKLLFIKTEDLVRSEPDIECRDIGRYYGPDVFAGNFRKNTGILQMQQFRKNKNRKNF